MPRRDASLMRGDLAAAAEVGLAQAVPAALMPEERRHQALLRMLGHVKDALASRLDELPTRRDLYLALAMAGYNMNPNWRISGEDPGLKARWANDDAEAMLALGSEDEI